MTYPADWLSWASGTLNGIGAPVNDTNLATLWNWTAAEKPAGQPSQWNNPLNTTQSAPGAVNQNSVGVKSFPDISTGVGATVQTLLNGNYPNIVANLRGSVPASQWGNACGNLGTWGTGCGWIGRAAPNVGSVGSGVASAVSGAVSGATGAAGGAAGSVLSAFAPFTKVGNCLAAPPFWWRIGFTALGAGLIIWGLVTYAAPAATKIAVTGGKIAAVGG